MRCSLCVDEEFRFEGKIVEGGQFLMPSSVNTNEI
jgi:hypothetical protein